MASVSLHQVKKSYCGTSHVVKGIDLEIADKEFVVLIGPSGCGKTTTLRMVAGLETISGGEIRIGGQIVNDIPSRDRNIAMVFQNYALYPHLTVYENIAFGLRMRGYRKAEIETRVKEVSEALGLQDFLQRRPKMLSGGQRQRVAMGRAIVRHPQVFLFDEPLSNLDAKLRAHMRTEIKRIHQAAQATTIYVTHDQVEAMTLADKVVMMNQGHIEQIGSPDDLYNRPASRFVAGFIGSPPMNFFNAEVISDHLGMHLLLEKDVKLSLPSAYASLYGSLKGEQVVCGIRPENFSVFETTSSETINITAVVEVVEPLGADTLIYFRLGQTFACARIEPHIRVAVNDRVQLKPDLARMHLFDNETGKVLTCSDKAGSGAS